MTTQFANTVSIKLGLLEITGNGVFGVAAVVLVIAALFAARYFRPLS